MNAYEQRLDLTVEGHQLMESVGALVNAIMIHRTLGKTLWPKPGNNATPTVGALGLEDVDCETFDFTYMRISSSELLYRIHTDIQAFCDSLRARQINEFAEPILGKLEIIFYQKKDSWPFQHSVPWEVWSIHVKVISLSAEFERQSLLKKLPEDMLQLMLIITTAINNHEQYIPSSLKRSDEDTVFDTRFSDCQPFLFRMSSTSADVTNNSVNTVGDTVKKIFKGTLQLGGN